MGADEESLLDNAAGSHSLRPVGFATRVVD